MVLNKKFHEIKKDVSSATSKLLKKEKPVEKHEEKPKFTMKEPAGDWSKRVNVDPSIWTTENYPNPKWNAPLYTWPTIRTTYGEIIDDQMSYLKKVYEQTIKFVLSLGITAISFFVLPGGLSYAFTVIFALVAGNYYMKMQNQKDTFNNIERHFTVLAAISKDPKYPPHFPRM